MADDKKPAEKAAISAKILNVSDKAPDLHVKIFGEVPPGNYSVEGFKGNVTVINTHPNDGYCQINLPAKAEARAFFTKGKKLSLTAEK